MGLNIESRIYKLTGITPMLGSQPANKAIRTQFIASKAPSPEIMEEENAIAPDIEEKGLTVFMRSPRDELCLMDYHLKGFLKEAISTLRPQLEIAAAKSKVDTNIFIEPRYVLIRRDGKPMRDEDDVLERTIRAETPKGPRTALQASEIVNDPWTIEIEISMLPTMKTPKSKELSWEAIETALDYGFLHGLGQWRNAGYGRFRWERVGEDDD